jgi:hypothetical protein
LLWKRKSMLLFLFRVWFFLIIYFTFKISYKIWTHIFLKERSLILDLFRITYIHIKLIVTVTGWEYRVSGFILSKSLVFMSEFRVHSWVTIA